MTDSGSPIIFKRKKRKNLREKILTDDDESLESNDDETLQIKKKMEEMKEIQKLRERPKGINIVGLALGKKISVEEEAALKDPFKINTGGLINMNALKSGKIKSNDDAYDTGIGTQFSAETNKRDEDEEMMKYIDEQLTKRKIIEKTSQKSEQIENKYLTPEEAALQSVPDYLRESTTQRSEEMLSNQMLSGIPEVDLGIEAKIKNIEATEEAKLKLFREKQNKKDGPSQFVPTNMAVNFVQHNRFNIDESNNQSKKPEVKEKHPKKISENSNEKKRKTEKATDDYHYEKFKKQFKRY